MRILFAIVLFFASSAFADWTNPTLEQKLMRNRGQIATLTYSKPCEALFRRSPGQISGYIVGVEKDVFGNDDLVLQTDHNRKYIPLSRIRGEIAITSPANALANLSLENQLVYEILRWAKATNGKVDLERRKVSAELKAKGLEFPLIDNREVFVDSFHSSVDGSTLIVTLYSNTKETGYFPFDVSIDQITAKASHRYPAPKR